MSEHRGPVDAGMDMCGKLESEDELQEWLEAAFEESGWTAIREVSPHSSDYRADLIVEHDEYGWFGIETKFIGSNQGPMDMAKAHHQIVQKYRGRKYIGNRIDLWAVCPYIKFTNCKEFPDDGKEDRRQRRRFEREKWGKINHTKAFFSHSGIGWINLNHYHLNMEFIQSTSGGRVPVGKLAEDDKVQQNTEQYQEYAGFHRDTCDMDMIREWASGKVDAAHYGSPDAVSPPE